jgi:alanine racemase
MRTSEATAKLATSGGRIVVDLGALVENYRLIARQAAPARTAAVVKADAYGLGAARVAPALAEAGCRDFFVALLQEALALEPLLPAEAAIYVLNGLAVGDEALCAETRVRPVLNSLAQARRWADAARDLGRTLGRPLPAAVQIDSGMSRFGLSADEVEALTADPAFREAVDVRLLMTHLACAGAPEAASNRAQLAAFRDLAGRFEGRPALSIANSAGSFLGPEFHGDLVRPGIALYGAATSPGQAGLLRPVVRLEARVAQVRHIPAGAGVGYDLAFTAERPSRIATLAVGYADGWPRRLGGPSGKGAAAWFQGHRLPIVGRVSMDSMAVDATDLPPDALAPDALAEGDYVELIGPNAPLETVAEQADTIPYEILTGLGARLSRTYLRPETSRSPS